MKKKCAFSFWASLQKKVCVEAEASGFACCASESKDGTGDDCARGGIGDMLLSGSAANGSSDTV